MFLNTQDVRAMYLMGLFSSDPVYNNGTEQD
jgi:hypothetical protein